MKNLTKIFMAVVAGMFAFSCVTDTTEDLGVNIQGGEKVTEVTLSLEAARTHIGEKDAKGEYPLYWSEGDAISVNGVVSNPLEGIGTEAATALFKFNESVTTPLCVVYPASAAQIAEEGEGEGEVTEPTPVTAYPVNFLATQPYTVGTFAPQAAPMYGYAAELPEGGIQMQHLTGVLRFAIAGNGEKVTKITVLSQNGKIAGAFTVDCTNGTLTADASASNAVNVTFAEPLVLGAEATPVYVTVPSGSYGTFMITITTEALEKMTVKFNSDVKPINAGVVREFKPFTFEANTNDAEDVFIIDSEEALIEFARIAGTFYPRTSAKVTATLDMSGYDWKPIENFGAFEFDGGKVEGYTINGLKAPLFATTNANISNVALTGIDYEVTDLAHSGAIACTLNGGSLNNCSAAGKININNTTLAEATGNYAGICHAGLVGYVSAAIVTNCTNDIDITVTSVGAPALEVGAAIGGIVGCASDNCSFNNLTNDGDLTYVGTNKKGNMYISGVVGKNSDAAGQDFIAFSNCTNNGAISTAKDSESANDILLTGITGRLEAADVVCDNLVNNGAITHNGKCGYFRGAGIVAYKASGSFTNCSNSKPISISSTGSVTNSLYLSGLFSDTVTAKTMDECHNTGDISVNSTFTMTGIAYLSGVAVGVSGKLADVPSVTDCSNRGAISFVGVTNETYSASGSGNNERICLGGVFYLANHGNFERCYNYESATITAKPVSWASRIMVGGLFGYCGDILGDDSTETQTLTFKNSYNEAAIVVAPTVSAESASIGGISAECYSKTKEVYHKFESTHNKGSITVTGKYVSSGNPRVGGYIGVENTTNVELKLCNNEGNITVTTTETAQPQVGGFIGADTNKGSLSIIQCENKAAIANSGLVTNSIYLGGFIGLKSTAKPTTISGSKNTGSVTLSGEQTPGASKSIRYFVGGFLGAATSGTSTVTISNCTNGDENDTTHTKGTVTAGATNSSSVVAGIVASSIGNISITGCKNYGTVSHVGAYAGNASESQNYGCYVGGIMGSNTYDRAGVASISNCENAGIVNVNVNTFRCRPEIGGIVGRFFAVEDNQVTSCKNSGTVSVTSANKIPKETSIGGIIGTLSGGQLVNCENTKTGEVVFGFETGTNLNVAGIAGSTNGYGANISYCKNNGAVKQTKKANSTTQIGGIVGYAYSFGSFTYCENHGPLTVLGGGTFGVGGIVGYARYQNPDAPGIIEYCYNDANLTFGGSASNYYAGGLIGRGVKATGAGGAEVSNLVNLGNITFTGTSAGTILIGGVMGQNGNALTDSQSYCDIIAVGMDGKVGMIMGQAYADASKATNCKIGGRIAFAATTKEEEDANGGDPIMVTTPTYTDIAADNWFNYIYSSGAVTEEVATGLGCELLGAKPATPVYTYTPAE